MHVSYIAILVGMNSLKSYPNCGGGFIAKKASINTMSCDGVPYCLPVAYFTNELATTYTVKRWCMVLTTSGGLSVSNGDFSADLPVSILNSTILHSY